MRDIAYIVRDMVIPEITKDAKHILLHLASREGDNETSWPSQRTLSECTNISIKGVQRALNCLLAHNLITRESGKLKGKANCYRVTIPATYIQEYYLKRDQGSGIRDQKKRDEGWGMRDERRGKRKKVGHSDLQGRPNETQGCVTVTYIKENNKEENKSKSVSNPTNRHTIAKNEAAKICYSLGASKEEAFKFWRYNEAKGWPLLDTMPLPDIAKRWIDEWQRREPESYAYEVNRRREAAQEQRIREMILKVRAEQEQENAGKKTPKIEGY